MGSSDQLEQTLQSSGNSVIFFVFVFSGYSVS